MCFPWNDSTWHSTIVSQYKLSRECGVADLSAWRAQTKIVGPLSLCCLCCLCLCHKCSGRSTSSRKQRFAGEEMAKRNLCLGRSSDSPQESVRMCKIAPRCSKSLTCCDVWCLFFDVLWFEFDWKKIKAHHLNQLILYTHWAVHWAVHLFILFDLFVYLVSLTSFNCGCGWMRLRFSHTTWARAGTKLQSPAQLTDLTDSEQIIFVPKLDQIQIGEIMRKS